MVRPRLEQLEDRLTPSAFAVSAGGLAVATDRVGDVYVL
jgi:hypothetical protein